MTRKRFIKLLMAHGEKRNKAQTMAFICSAANYSYQKAYFDYYNKNCSKWAMQKLSLALVNVGTSAQKLGCVLKGLLEVMKE